MMMVYCAHSTITYCFSPSSSSCSCSKFSSSTSSSSSSSSSLSSWCYYNNKTPRFVAVPQEMERWRSLMAQEFKYGFDQGNKNIFNEGIVLATDELGRVVQRGVGLPTIERWEEAFEKWWKWSNNYYKMAMILQVKRPKKNKGGYVVSIIRSHCFKAVRCRITFINKRQINAMHIAHSIGKNNLHKNMTW